MAEARKKQNNIYYVTQRKNKEGKKVGWEVKKGGAMRVTKILDTKVDAIDYAKSLSANSGCTIMVKKMDGSHDETIKFEKK